MENAACTNGDHPELALHAAAQEKVNALWRGVMNRLNVPIVGNFHYATLALIILGASLSQMLYPVIEGTPSPCKESDTEYTVGSEKTKYKNLFGKECNLGDTLYQLADATGMATLAVQQPEYPRMRERLRRLQHQTDFNAELSLGFLQAALSEGMVSVGLIGVMENMLQ